MSALECPVCNHDCRRLIFFDNGYNSCDDCAGDVRKRPKQSYQETQRQFDGAEHYRDLKRKKSRT